MIDFLQRGFRFASFIIRRWFRAKQVAFRSRFFLWLDINLCFDAEAPLSFDAAQELSKSFTQTILRPTREDGVSKFAVKPGIFIVSNVTAKGFKLDLPRAVCLRLLTPRSRHLSLSIDLTRRALAANAMHPKTRPVLVNAVTGPHFSVTQIRNVLTDALSARLVSNPDSNL